MVDRRRGFTLVEVVIAAGLLGVFAAVAARPLLQAALATSLAGDRAAAVYYAMAGIEWARGSGYSEFTGTGFGGTHVFVDPSRGITYRRITSKETMMPKAPSGEWVIWRVTSTVAPLLSGPYSESPPRTVRRLGEKDTTELTDIKIVSYQCYWLMPTMDLATSN